MNDSSAMNNERQRRATRSFSRKYLENGERSVDLYLRLPGKREIERKSARSLRQMKTLPTSIRWIIESTRLQDTPTVLLKNRKYLRSYFSAAYGDHFFGVVLVTTFILPLLGGTLQRRKVEGRYASL